MCQNTVSKIKNIRELLAQVREHAFTFDVSDPEETISALAKVTSVFPYLPKSRFPLARISQGLSKSNPEF